MDHGTWMTQLRKGALDAVVLGVLARERRLYGLALLDRLNAAGLGVTEGALYPLLARLEKAEVLAASWVMEDGASHPRKYYTLTPAGIGLLAQMRPSWDAFSAQVTDLMKERSQL